MGFLKAIPIIGDLLKKGSDIIDQRVQDKDLAAQLKQDLEKSYLSADLSSMQEQASVIKVEAQGESFLQRNWRPIIMLMFGYVIFNNFILAPYVQCFYHAFPILPVPTDLWDLLKLGIGGYVVGRSAEKITKTVMDSKKAQTQQ
jgi:hypothetical protein